MFKLAISDRFRNSYRDWQSRIILIPAGKSTLQINWDLFSPFWSQNVVFLLQITCDLDLAQFTIGASQPCNFHSADYHLCLHIPTCAIVFHHMFLPLQRWPNVCASQKYVVLAQARYDSTEIHSSKFRMCLQQASARLSSFSKRCSNTLFPGSPGIYVEFERVFERFCLLILIDIGRNKGSTRSVVIMGHELPFILSKNYLFSKLSFLTLTTCLQCRPSFVLL